MHHDADTETCTPRQTARRYNGFFGSGRCVCVLVLRWGYVQLVRVCVSVWTQHIPSHMAKVCSARELYCVHGERMQTHTNTLHTFENIVQYCIRRALPTTTLRCHAFVVKCGSYTHTHTRARAHTHTNTPSPSNS